MAEITLPDGFRHHQPIQVRWGDVDALGHVNNAVYLTYLEQARITYFNDLGLWDGTSSGLGLIMAKATIEYQLPLFARDDVHVFTRCSRLGNSSFDTEQWIMRRETDGTLSRAALAVIVIVVFDYAANRSTPIPDGWRERLQG